MLIAGLNKTTLLDYPGRVAATIFTGGCNFRCPFCHNGDLVLKPSSLEMISEEEVLSFLQKRKNVLKGVCITGGEPTLQADLRDLIRKIKEIGYEVKLDTNGYLPDVLKTLLDEELLDYVAMDIKSSKEKYRLVAGLENMDIGRIERSMELLKNSGISYEYRTTVVKGLHASEDILEIGKWIEKQPFAGYYLQTYKENEKSILNLSSPRTELFASFTKEEMQAMANMLNGLSGMNNRVFLRGVE